MDVSQVGWLLAGVGLGVAGQWAWPRRRKSKPSLGMAIDPWELNYRLASEMSQFKAGFLARTSHELRAPLNGVIGMHQLILSDLCDGPEEERDFIGQANESALKLVEILDRLILVSKTEYGSVTFDLKPLQLDYVIQEVYSLVELPAKNRNIELCFPKIDPSLHVIADPRSFRQVLLKLIDLPLNHMQEGCISLDVQPIPERGQLTVTITDTDSDRGWSEATDYLQTDLLPDTRIPTQGLTLLSIQTLMDLMNGRLEVIAQTPEAVVNRIQCTVPMA